MSSSRDCPPPPTGASSMTNAPASGCLNGDKISQSAVYHDRGTDSTHDRGHHLPVGAVASLVVPIGSLSPPRVSLPLPLSSSSSSSSLPFNSSLGRYHRSDRVATSSHHPQSPHAPSSPHRAYIRPCCLSCVSRRDKAGVRVKRGLDLASFLLFAPLPSIIQSFVLSCKENNCV
jgi:hypothetical protein